MTLLLGIPDLVVIGCMLMVSASVGLYFRFTGGRQKTTHEFLMAGRAMSVGPVAFSLMATHMSAISLLGMPAETYMYGTQFWFFMVGLPIGALVVTYGLLPVFFHLDVCTAYEYLEKRFGKTTRTIASLLFTIQMVLYMAVVLYAPSLALNAVTGLSTWASVILLALVCIFYCSLGGLKAVLWTDVFQSFLMYFTIIAVVVAVVVRIGFQQVIDIAEDGERLIFFNISTDPTERYTVWNSLLSGVLFSFNSFGTNQAQIQRILSVGSLKKAKRAIFWSIPLIVVYHSFSYMDGVVLYALFHQCDPMMDPDTKLTSPDQMMPYALVDLFGRFPGVPGLCIAGIFSASLSTISSAVNSLTAVMMEDFIRPFCNCATLTESRATVLAKLLGVAYGALTVLLTFVVAHFRGVMEASSILYGMVGGPVLGIFALGMFTKTANETGTLLGLLSGFVINAWIGFGSYVAKPHVETLPRTIAGCPNTNASALMTTVSMLSDTDEQKYIFPLYRTSFLWFPIIGCLVVLIVGYGASLLIRFCTDAPEVNPFTLSPFVRKCLVKVEQEKEGEYRNRNGCEKSYETTEFRN